MPLPSGFEDRLAAMSDAEVLAIIVKPDDYQHAAVALARSEVARRNLSTDQVAVAAQAERNTDAAVAAKADVPLSTAMRLLCFIPGPSLWMIFAAIGYGGYGYKRKARETWLWLLCGVAFWLAVGFLVIIFVPEARAKPH